MGDEGPSVSLVNTSFFNDRKTVLDGRLRTNGTFEMWSILDELLEQVLCALLFLLVD